MRRNLPCRAAQSTASARACKNLGRGRRCRTNQRTGLDRESAAASRAGRGGEHARGGRSHCRIIRTNSTAPGGTPCSAALGSALWQPPTAHPHRPRIMGEDDADVHRTERTGRSIGRSAVVPLKPDAALPIGALLTDRVATDTSTKPAKRSLIFLLFSFRRRFPSVHGAPVHMENGG
jgi:hypothetical protein